MRTEDKADYEYIILNVYHVAMSVIRTYL